MHFANSNTNISFFITNTEPYVRGKKYIWTKKKTFYLFRHRYVTTTTKNFIIISIIIILIQKMAQLYTQGN